MDVEDNLLEPESLMRYSNLENISQVEGELRWQLKEQTDRQSNTGRGEGEIESSACLSPPCACVDNKQRVSTPACYLLL